MATSTGSFDDRVAESIPFHLKGYDGIVSVYYGANTDPHKAGFDALPGISFDVSACLGYPVMAARIEAYHGAGYRMLCGWIQIITSVYTDSRDGGDTRTETFVSLDVAPSLQEADLPFCTFGFLPQMFDAPCLNLGDHAELRWTADTFLTTVPLRSRAEGISRLLGFRWGYIENNVPDEAPTLLPLEVTGEQAWHEHLAYLREQYGNWRFERA